MKTKLQFTYDTSASNGKAVVEVVATAADGGEVYRKRIDPKSDVARSDYAGAVAKRAGLVKQFPQIKRQLEHDLEAIQEQLERRGGPVLECFADIEPVAVSWLWAGRIPAGRITLFVGAPGEGKSFASIDFAARVSTGSPWPDGSPCARGSVILVSAEDNKKDTIRPRLDAHRADVKRVHLLAAVHRIDNEGKRREFLFALTDLPALEDCLKRISDCRLLVIDPIGSFLGHDTDSHRDNEVRSVLAPVAALAERYGPAVLVIAHRRKGLAGSADESAMGSRAFTGIARATWHLSRDPQNKHRRLFLPGKNNLAPEGDGLAFTIGGDPPCIEWELEPVQQSADEALEAERDASGAGRPPDEREAAESWLADLLHDGMPHKVAEVREAANAAGVARGRTLERAAAGIGVKYERATFGGPYTWRLATPAPALARQNVGQFSTHKDSGEHGEQGEFPRKIDGTCSPESLARQKYLLGGHEGVDSNKMEGGGQ